MYEVTPQLLLREPSSRSSYAGIGRNDPDGDTKLGQAQLDEHRELQLTHTTNTSRSHADKGARGRPRSIRCDNGPEFTSRHFLGWCEEQQIRLLHIQPGRPMQNGRVESFNGRLRDECLNASWFLTLAEAKQKIEAWREDYNRERPHSSLGYQTPEQFARAWRPFAVESFDSAGCSARQGNPGGRASLGLDPPPPRHSESLYDGEGAG